MLLSLRAFYLEYDPCNIWCDSQPWLLLILSEYLFCAYRFKNVAYLQQMWWVEVIGELEFVFPVGSYTIIFRLQLGKTFKRLGRRMCNVDQVHGWDIKPVRFQVSTSDGQCSLLECYLDGPGEWIYYQVGDFVVEKPNKPLKIKFSLAQIDCTHTKGGLCIDSAIICPTEFRERLKQF